MKRGVTNTKIAKQVKRRVGQYFYGTSMIKSQPVHNTTEYIDVKKNLKRNGNNLI